jgi:archaeosine synthase
MTKYFEVTRRDAAARLGKLLLKKQYPTPLILSKNKEIPIIYAGSLWSRDTLSPDDVKPDTLVILPDKSMPLHARHEKVKEIIASCKHAIQVWDNWNGPVGRIVHPACPDISRADLYGIGAAKQLENNPRMLAKTVVHIKNNTLPDTALYAPALATPENLSMLIYLGIDIVDDILPTIKAFDDTYMMPYGEYRLSTLSELPCTCSVCDTTSIEALMATEPRRRSELIVQHNRNRLEEERRITVQHIKNGTLREYVEGKCRSMPWLAALLRLLDQEQNYLEQRTPTYRHSTMYTTTSESLNRAEIKRFAQRITSRYCGSDANMVVLLPCSARKPYSTSNSHRMFSRAIGRNRRAVNEVIITSPLGIVPRELEIVYPAAHYDTPVTGYWDLEERSWVTKCLIDYLKGYNYSHIIAHVDGAYEEICQSAAKTLNLKIIYTARGSVTSSQSLSTLASTVSTIVEEEGYRLCKPAEITINMLRAIADYQFGKGAGHLIVPDGATIKAPYPRHQIYDGNWQLATLNPRTGALIPTLKGAQRLLRMGTYQVHVGDFIPSGSLLAPGVVDADVCIRPDDQVIVVGERVFGVGKALMSGSEMVQSTRGQAVDLRHVEEI